jgi:predicted enzyme related to lactoylglutathione lyase
MPEFTSHAAGSPCWVDLMSPDIDASKSFYEAVFGWTGDDEHDPEGNRVYVTFRLDGKVVAGLGGQPPGMETMPAIWNTYVCVDDPAATVAAATDAGGSVMMPPMQVMDAGHMAILADPTGATISLWKPGGHFGSELCNEPDTWSWSELMTRDVDTALTFYSAVFGWTYAPHDMGDFVYQVIEGGENDGWGGIMPMPSEVPDMVPNHWAVYFSVADTSATSAKVTAGGGQAVQEPMDIPGVGRMATFHDPHGGSFATLQPTADG